MKTRIIHTKFWADGYISGLTKGEKLLFLYLLTNEKVGLCGIYELPDKYIRLVLEYSQEELDTYKKKFQKDHKFVFDNGWIAILNVVKYQNYSGEKNEVAIKRELSYVPKSLLDTLSIEYRYPMDTLLNKKPEIRNQNSEIKNQKKETINQKLEETRDFIKNDFKISGDREEVPF